MNFERDRFARYSLYDIRYPRRSCAGLVSSRTHGIVGSCEVTECDEKLLNMAGPVTRTEYYPPGRGVLLVISQKNFNNFNASERASIIVYVLEITFTR